MRIAIAVLALSAVGCDAANGRSSADGGPAPGDGAMTSPDASPIGGGAEAGSGSGDGGCTNVIDLVFVLDVSSSMDFVLDKLNAEIDAVVTAANQLAKDSHFGLIAFVDNYKLDTTGPLSQGRVHTDGATLKTAFDYYKNTDTFPNRNPGDGPGGPTNQNPICEENSLDALHGAATDFPWRDNATRVVILVTDDTFLERPDTYGSCWPDATTGGKPGHACQFTQSSSYPASSTVAETVAALKTLQARVFTFTRLTPPSLLDLSRCGTGRRLPWTAISDGWTTPYVGSASHPTSPAQPPIPQQTGGKNYDLDQVKAGQLSLSTTINQIVVTSYCTPIM